MSEDTHAPSLEELSNIRGEHECKQTAQRIPVLREVRMTSSGRSDGSSGDGRAGQAWWIAAIEQLCWLIGWLVGWMKHGWVGG